MSDQDSLESRLYTYADCDVLRNNFGIKDPQRLAMAERNCVNQRIEQGCPRGKFDLDHLCSIHRHLFQDVYPWAGDIRQVDIIKGSSSFLPADRIQMAFDDISKRLKNNNYLKNQSKSQFADKAAEIIGDVNYVHPFREGNGRTQLQYLKQLGEHAGHTIYLTTFTQKQWISASIAAHNADYSSMARCIRQALTPQQASIQERIEKTRLSLRQSENVGPLRTSTSQSDKNPLIDLAINRLKEARSKQPQTRVRKR